ncbi:MAG: ATP-binding cassette domain-containing protein [Acidobacteriota bacterium]
MEAKDYIVEARILTKRFGDLIAVDGIDFTVRRGECFGFLGPNGAGKTTTVKMIYCFLPISSGSIRVFGLDVNRNPRGIKHRIGVSPQEDNLDPDFTALQNLTTYARYFGISKKEARRRGEELLEFMKLTDKKDTRIRELSGGMKRRLVLARSLINRPELLLLDEPTTGLDPQARHSIWRRIRALKAEGTTILLTTHYMEEAAQLCDRIVIMDKGKIVVEGTPAELTGRLIGKEVLEVWVYDESLLDYLTTNGWDFEIASDRVFIYSGDEQRDFHDILNRFAMRHYIHRPASLEDVFLKLTGRELRE